MPVSRTEFTSAMAAVAAPVTVVTTMDPQGRRRGFTASSFCSLSLDPPLVLVCLAKSSSSHPAFAAADHFIVNVLADRHADLALRFAVPGADKFAGGEMVPCERGLPGLSDAAVRLSCAVHAFLDGGDHTILVGQVEGVDRTETTPLLYHKRTFTRPAVLDQAAG
ncbi:flavin reductase family protein [Actinokineospora sp. G85]|uniref:flavin reductase family protein n=1 Tax=Actinokineospora sp. G85 TaxID=3406626 RepID=UPI003C7516D9